MITLNRYTLTATTLTPIRVGGKNDPLSEADNPVAAVGGRICLPGPSLKGALRNAVERHLNDRFYDSASNRWASPQLPAQPCIPSTHFSSDEQRLIGEGRYRSRACRYPANNEGICPACYLLGAQGLVGFVSVPFLFTDVSYDELYSLRLDRASHIKVDGTNRPYQLVPPDTQFTGVLEVVLHDDLLGWRLGLPRPLKESRGDAWLTIGDWSAEKVLQELLLDRLTAIRSLGGYRSKGFGNVKIRVEKIESKAQAVPQ